MYHEMGIWLAENGYFWSFILLFYWYITIPVVGILLWLVVKLWRSGWILAMFFRVLVVLAIIMAGEKYGMIGLVSLFVLALAVELTVAKWIGDFKDKVKGEG